MLFGETVTVYCENHKKKKQNKYTQWTECRLLYVKAGDTYSNHWGSNVLSNVLTEHFNHKILGYILQPIKMNPQDSRRQGGLQVWKVSEKILKRQLGTDDMKWEVELRAKNL
jgi:hypothetical protein